MIDLVGHLWMPLFLIKEVVKACWHATQTTGDVACGCRILAMRTCLAVSEGALWKLTLTVGS